MAVNIPETGQKRIVIVGAGFAGLKLATKLANSPYQVILVDKNNYHQFQPLYYQVATAGLEPSAIAFPLRKVFQGYKNMHIRVSELEKIDTEKKFIETDLGTLTYDYLVLALGTNTNFFGMKSMIENAIPMKSVSEALALRNRMLLNFENALITEDEDEKQGLLNILIVGGGPTGVEVAGAIADMRRDILPKDYPELDFKQMNIYLVESSPKTLNVMAQVSSEKSQQYLEKLGVIVKTNTTVKDFDGKFAYLGDGASIRTNTLIWAAGVIAPKIEGLNPEVLTKGNRINVDKFNRVQGYSDIFALGDMASMIDEAFPKGHPQLAQPAMQQAVNLAANFKKMLANKPLNDFKYKDLGTMATVGRNLAVVELPFWKFQGFFAWLTWMLVHLMSIVGVKNRVFIFINWCWNYITYDQSLRLILKPAKDKKEKLAEIGNG